MIVSLVVAAGLDDGIGKDGRMPWHLPADLKHFKHLTLGKPVIMGRKTLESIGRPLPERRNLVITRDRVFGPPGVETCRSLEEALERAEGSREVMVIGGGEIYRLALDRADRVYLTRVHVQTDADTFFPKLDANEWQEIARDEYKADEKNPVDYTFLILERR